MLFKTTEDKATFYINHYASAILNAVKGDIKKVAQATGNKESEKSLKLQAQAALWIAVCENPELTGKELLEIAKSLFSSWVRDEYEEERIRTRTNKYPGHGRKDSPISYTTMPWGAVSSNKQLISQSEQPDALIEKEDDLKQIVRVMDKLITDWGPQAAVWAIADFRSSGIFDAARNLGFTEEELKSAKVRNKLRKIYRVMADIRLELGANI